MTDKKVASEPSVDRALSAMISFRTENFRSIRDEQVISAVSGSVSELQEVLIPAKGATAPLLPVLAVYGANAAGKSTAFLALKFMCDAVRDSQRTWEPDAPVPYEPFLLDESSRAQPSLFEMDFLIRGVRYVYGFVLNSSHVVEEWLFAYPKGRKQEWFVRDEQRFKYSRELSGENAAIERLTRPNSLFLSAAAQNNHVQLSIVYRWFATGVKFVVSGDRDRLPSRTTRALRENRRKDEILRLLRMADLGVENVELSREEMGEEMKNTLTQLFAGDKNASEALLKDPFIDRVLLRHSVEGTEGVLLPFETESSGTRTLYGLASLIVSVIATGGLLLIDELDSSLHPILARELVQLFQRPESNPRRAQLIFNTHDTNLLDASLLRRDQIWFAEKSLLGATKLYALSEFKPRRVENTRRGYLQGRYGAIPFLEAAQLVDVEERFDGETK